jgi:hypothetical protein
MHNWVWSLFYDVGTAWDQGNPLSQRNPINVEFVQRAPFTISVQSLKSPFVQGLGTGLEGIVSGFDCRLDIAVPIEDGFVDVPRLMVSFGRSF